ncbi:MAG: YfhO family protein [Clostridia bacterium]
MMNKIKSFFRSKSFIIGAASFMLPALVLYVVFAFNHVHPFGDKQIIVTDFWHQYYPFLCTLQEALKTGGSLLYAEGIGLGINFLSLIAYYCASPLNILTIFVSKEALRDLVTVIVALKVGFSGLFFSIYLKKVFKSYDFSTVAFSALYALCGYVLGYYWNIMWLDTVAMLPLVMLGVYLLVKENKVVLYVISLALSVIFNFYIGFMVCIFTAIYFFAECLKSNLKIKEFLQKLLLIGVSSVVALALTAFITIPAYNTLGDTVSSVPKTTTEKTFSEKVMDSVKEFGKDIGDVTGRLATFNEPVPKSGLPNIFSGLISVMLLGFFFSAKKISLREKIAVFCMIALLLISMSVSNIDIIWHGFHKPNMVPYRYAFILSFVLISTGYRTYREIFTEDGEGVNKSGVKIGLAVAFILAAVVNFCAMKEAKTATILASFALAVVYVVAMQSYFSEKKSNRKENWTKLICSLVVLEVIVNTVIAVPTVRTTTYSTYYYRGEEIEELLERVDAKSSLGRVETAQEFILNDPALYGYKGVSTFSSTANYNVTKLMEKLAICAPPRANRYYYETTSPLTNAFLSVERVIFKNSMKNLNPYLVKEESTVTEDGKYNIDIYKNTQYLSLGFMTENTLAEGINGKNAFEIQNDLFRKATGLEGDLFTRMDIASVPSSNTVKVFGSDGKYDITLEEGETDKKLEINYVAPDTNPIFAYIDCVCADSVSIDNTSYKAVKRKYIFPVGQYNEGEKFTFEFKLNSDFPKKKDLVFRVYSLNSELFEQGMELLKDEQLEITAYKSTYIEGNIDVKKDGYLYTSIPYEDGWRMYVDGKETVIEPFEDAMIAVKLTKGNHNIVLKYSPEGFTVGVIISFVALVVLIGVIVYTRRKKHGQNIGNSALL